MQPSTHHHGPALQEISFVSRRVPLRQPAERPARTKFHGAVRQRTGETVQHTRADITRMSKNDMTLRTDASIKVGEILQVVASLGGREVRLLAQVVQLRAELSGSECSARAHILAVAKDDRAQFASHVETGRRAERESLRKTRRALQGRHA